MVKRAKTKSPRTVPAKVATVIIVPVEEVGWLRQLGQRVAAFYAGPVQEPEIRIEVVDKPKRRKYKRKPQK